MSWSTEFYTAVMSDANFAAGIESLAYEYKPNAVAPFATYQEISAIGNATLQGATIEGLSRIQLSVWASSPTLAEQLAQYAITGAGSLSVGDIFRRSLGFDSDENLHGYAVDLMIWFENP